MKIIRIKASRRGCDQGTNECSTSYSVIKNLLLCSRYDYENVDIDAACEMMEDVEIMIADKSFLKQRFAVEDKVYQVEKADNFEYTDPVDSTISRNQVHDTHWAVLL